MDSVSEHVWRWESEVSEDLEDFIENAEGEIDEDLWQELNDWMLPAGWCVDFDKKGNFQRNVTELVKNLIPKLEISDEMLQEICDKDVIAYDEEEDVYCFDGYDLELASNEYLLEPFSDSISTQLKKLELGISVLYAEEKARRCCLKLDEMMSVLSEDHLADTENLKDVDTNSVKILLNEFAKMEDLESYDIETIRELQGKMSSIQKEFEAKLEVLS